MSLSIREVCELEKSAAHWRQVKPNHRSASRYEQWRAPTPERVQEVLERVLCKSGDPSAGRGHRVISSFGNIVERSLHFRVMTPWGTNDFWKKILKYRFIDFWGFLIGTIFKNQKMDQPSIPFESALNSASNDTLLVLKIGISFFGGVVFAPS